VLAANPPPPAPNDLLLDAQEKRQCDALSHFAVGLLLQFEGKKGYQDLAEMRLRRALQLAPESAFAAEAAVYQPLMRRDFATVVQMLQPILAAHPGEAHLVLLCAEALESDGKKNEAIACLEKGLREGKWSSGKILRRLFSLLWENGREKDAERLLRKAGRSRRLRGSFDYHYAVALHANMVGIRDAREGRSERVQERARKKALDHARKAVRAATLDADPEEIEAIANLLLDAGEWQEARRLLERFADEYDAPELWLLKARVLACCGSTREAAAYLDELVADYLPFECFPEAANILVEADQPRAAARIFRRFLTEDPDSVPARIQLAYIYLTMDQAAAGLRILQPVHTLPPEAILITAHLYEQLGQHTEALRAVERAKALARERKDKDLVTVDLLLFTATLHEENGELPAAVDAARQALALSPDSAECANYLGYLLADSNRELTEAERLIRQAIAKDRGSAAYWDSLAWVLHRQGRNQEALGAINHSLRLAGGHHAVILDHAGDINAAQNLAVAARLYWTQALAADVPKPDAVRRKIETLGPVDVPGNDR
jgi:tetratricopeptide (TPR) repeat protein